MDYFFLGETKLVKDQEVLVCAYRHVYDFSPAFITTEMDELVYLKSNNKDLGLNWEATDKGRIFLKEVWLNTHMQTEVTKYESFCHQQQLKTAEQARQRRMGGRVNRNQVAAKEIQDGMDVDEEGAAEDVADDDQARHRGPYEGDGLGD